MVEESPHYLYIWGSEYDVTYELLEDSATDGSAWGTDENFQGGQDTEGYDDYNYDDDEEYNDNDDDYNDDDYDDGNYDDDEYAEDGDTADDYDYDWDNYDYDDYEYDRGDWTEDYNEDVNENVQNPDGSYIIAEDLASFVQLLIDCETIDEIVFVAVFNILSWLGLR